VNGWMAPVNGLNGVIGRQLDRELSTLH